MISIVNITDPPKSDLCTYSLRINDREICQFTHERGDALNMCLRRAATAYEAHLHDNVQEFISRRGK